MNMKTTLGLVALAMLALSAMTPTATATYTSDHVTVCTASLTGDMCGAKDDSWGTVEAKVGPIRQCVTTFLGHPTSGC